MGLGGDIVCQLGSVNVELPGDGLVLTEFDTSLPILSYPPYTRSLHISRNPIPLSKPQLALRRMAPA